MIEDDARVEALRREIDAAQRELWALVRERTGGPHEDVWLGTPSGPRRLSSWFEGREALIVAIDGGEQAPPVWVDALAAGALALSELAATLVVTAEPAEGLDAWAASRGLAGPVASHAGTTLLADLGLLEADGAAIPGLVTLRQGPAGLVRVAVWRHHPGDPFAPVFHVLSLL